SARAASTRFPQVESRVRLSQRPWRSQCSLARKTESPLVIAGHSYPVAVAKDRDRVWVSIAGEPVECEVARARSGVAREKKAEPEVKSPIAGKLQRLFVKVGDVVVSGQKLLSIEAMKMENEIHATLAGTVERIAVSVGQALQPGELLLVVKETKPE